MRTPEVSQDIAFLEGMRAEALENRIAELTAAVEARDTFIAIAAHELRNPMMPIIGQVELLLSAVKAGRCPPGQVEQRLENLQHTIRHYMKRAGILLDVSRITSGKLRLELESFDFAVLLREVADEFLEPARHAGVAITVTGAAGLHVTWDRLAAEQIVDNLVSNALKYGGHTPVEVSAAASGDQITLRVRDHGPGIPARDAVRVFGRFERAVGHGERRSGFGVGLWVVGQLVAAMGGTIAVEDAPGGGALFTVCLPRHVNGTRA